MGNIIRQKVHRADESVRISVDSHVRLYMREVVSNSLDDYQEVVIWAYAYNATIDFVKESVDIYLNKKNIVWEKFQRKE